MPYYRWFAISIDGDEYTGEVWAADEKQLEDLLLEKELGLMQAKRKKLALIEKMSLDEQVQLFEQLQKLVGAGLLISQALSVISRHGSSLKCALTFELSQSVKHGASFAHSLLAFPQLFNPLLISLIQSGEESGNLSVALTNLVHFLQMQLSLRKKIRSALQVPFITLLFFIAIILVIFLAIIPSFEQLTIVTNQQFPNSLQRLINWSHQLQAISLIRLLLIMSATIASLWFFIKTAVYKKIKSWILTHVSGFRTIYWSLALSFFFQALSLLMRGGKSLVEAMRLIAVLSDNEYVKKRLTFFTEQVASGIPIDEAYEQVFDTLALADVAAMLVVGNESGSLAIMTEHISELYFERAEKRLKRFAVILQPLLLIIMGWLVAALIYAVYVPIMQLPETLGTM